MDARSTEDLPDTKPARISRVTRFVRRIRRRVARTYYREPQHWLFEDVLADQLPQDMADFSGRRTRPSKPGEWVSFGEWPEEWVSAGELQVDQPATRHIDLVPLGDDDEAWDKFHARVRRGVKHNMGPWNRCLSLLRHHGAAICVIERHYVCLDLRSEVAAFNSQLDMTIDRAATRFHFFADEVRKNDLYQLTEHQKDSYLGYIILREPGAPIVGRSVLKAPDYIKVCATIDEPVHFLGQDLTVVGVPFMQQDERYAVCAHVAVWILLYVAYRRGLIERHLIADVVAASTTHRTMHPSAPTGLTLGEVREVIQTLGLHLQMYDLSDNASFPLGDLVLGDIDYSAEQVTAVEQVYERLVACLDLVPSASQVTLHEDPNVFMAHLWNLVNFARGQTAIRDDDAEEHKRQIEQSLTDYEIARRLLDDALRHLITPYLRSGFPIYCHTADHAMVLCGYSEDARGHVYYFHDDNYGPYVATRSIMGASRQAFVSQAYSQPDDSSIRVGKGGGISAAPTPKVDLAQPIHVSHDWADSDRAVIAVGAPAPERLLLFPVAAKDALGEFVDQVWGAWKEIEPDAVRPKMKLRSSIMMGIDYKSQRRAQCLADKNALKLFSCAHLAEWVILVESIDADGGVEWEFVYDGTSSNRHPILQLARVGDRVVYRNPIIAPIIESFAIDTVKFPRIVVPRRIGKLGRRSDTVGEG